MGKSSGGGSQPTGSQTVTQDIAEPFKGFITRSLQRAEDLQGLPSLPFTGIATAPPTPDELVGAQSLRNRFMEHQPLTEQAIALQTTAADPITAQGILARQNPFQAQIAQEAYRRLDENTQRDLQDQRAREVNSGGFRARGAIEDHLLRQRQQDQERQIGLEAGNRAFTEASKLAIADRDARGTTAAGINQRLQERQNLGRVDIDDILRVGAQQRETFIQPEINLERQQFQEQRGPGSMQNPFGFEQFFSGIRSAAPSPTVSTQQQFQQPKSGLQTAANVVGGGLATADNFGAFNKAEGGIINFDQGGIAQFSKGRAATLEEKRAIRAEIFRLSDLFASFERTPGQATPEQIQNMRDVARALRENKSEMDLPGLEALTEEVNRILAASKNNKIAPEITPEITVETLPPPKYTDKQSTYSGLPREEAAQLKTDAIRAKMRELNLDPDNDTDNAASDAAEYIRHNEGEDTAINQIADQSEGITYPAINYPAPAPVQEAPEEYWAESLEGLPDRMAEMVKGRAVSPEPERKYSDAEITAMLNFSTSGRGRDGLPDGLRNLDTFEVREALKPIRERAAKASKARREKERRDRISNRSGFRNRRLDSGIAPETKSYEFGIQDIKDLFDFKDGGIASFKEGGFKAKSGLSANSKGGIASFKDGRKVEVQNELAYDLRDGTRYDSGGLGRVPAYPSRTEELTEVAEEMANNDFDFDGTAAGSTKEERARKEIEKVKALIAAEATDTPTPTEGAEEVPYMEQIMKTYMDSLKPSETKGYPSKPKLTGEQQRSGAIQAIAQALMSVSSDEAGNADFSRMGSAAAASSNKTLADLEAARKEEVAAASARSSSILTGLMANTKMAQEMSQAQLNTVNAALKEQERLHPEWRVQKIAMEALLPLHASGMLKPGQYAEIMLELGFGQTNTGSGLDMPGTDALEKAKAAALNH